MPKGTVSEESEYRYEEGWYRARLESVVEREVEFTYKADSPVVKRGDARPGQQGSFLQWRWTVKFTTGEHTGDTISADTDPKISTRADSLARILYEAFLGRALEVGESVDTDLIEGLHAEVLVSQDPPRMKRDGTKGYYCSIADARAIGGSVGSDPFDDEPPF